MKLFINGELRGTRPETGSFAWIGNNHRNFLGRSNWRESLPAINEDFQGQMKEVRVWSGVRTEAARTKAIEPPVPVSEAVATPSWPSPMTTAARSADRASIMISRRPSTY